MDKLYLINTLSTASIYKAAIIKKEKKGFIP